MSNQPVVFLHGWRGDESTYGKLPQVLSRAGYDPKHLYLGEYMTGWDDITIDDLAIAFQAALTDKHILDRGAFHCVVHSTGALVARNWIHRFYGEEEQQRLPMRHLVMAAPANNGSRLASWGKKLPWDWGNNILKALELASPITWALNVRWMAAEYAYRAGFLPSLLIAGNNKQDLPWYTKPFSRALAPMEKDMPVFEEEGSDNTVRGCAANLNMSYYRHEPGDPGVVLKGNMKDIPVWFFPDHSHTGNRRGILKSIKTAQHPVAAAILQILGAGGRNDPPVASQPAALPGAYPYAMVNVRVVDQLGNPVPEALIWWYDDPPGALETRHTHDSGEIVCFYVKKTERLRRAGFYVEAPKKGGAPFYPLRWEYERSAELDLFRSGQVDLIPTGQTTFVEVVLKKKMGEKVLKLKPLRS